MPDVIPGIEGGRLEHTAADDEVFCTAWGLDELPRIRRGEEHVRFLFSRLKSLSLGGSGGNCCSHFIPWEEGGCLPEAAGSGSFAFCRQPLV